MKIAEKYRLPLAFAGILLLVCLLYWPGLKGPFVLDDQQNVVSIHLEKFDTEAFIYMVTHNTSGMLGRLVSVCSFVVSDLVSGLDPWGYKLHNLLLHLCTGVLLLRLLLTTLPLLVPTLTAQQTRVCAVITAAFWLLHPLQVSTVLYVVQRMTILAVLFTLAALLCYLAARHAAPGGGRRYWLLAFVLYPLLQLLAVFSKEIGALLPLYLLAYEVLVFRSLRSPASLPRRHQIFLAVFVGFPLAVGALYFFTHTGKFLDYSTRNFTLVERLLTQVHVVPAYLKMILLPRARDMSLFHDDFPITSSLDPVTLALLALLLAMAAAIWLLRERAPVVAFGLAWFFIGHLIESTVIPLEPMFEHRNYLALAGILLPVIYHVGTYRERKLAYAGLSLFMLVFLLATSSRVLEWSTDELMHTQAVMDHPGSTRARTNMANMLSTQNRFQEAMAQLEAAEKVDPKDAGIPMHELTLLCALELKSPELVDRAEKVLSQYPASVYALNSFEHLYSLINSEKCKQVSQTDMERLLNAALKQTGNTANDLVRGYLLRLQGFQALLSGEYVQGVVYMRQAFEANGDVIILGELIESQINFGKLEDAEFTLEFFREVNRQHHGIDSWRLDKAEKSLQEAKSKPKPASTEAVDATVPAATGVQ